MSPEELAALHALAFAGEAGRPWTSPEFAALLEGPGAILSGDGRAMALGRVAADEAEVLTLAAHPAHRRQGLATAALRDLERRARASGAGRAFLEVAEENLAARALYAAAGYAPLGRRRDYYGPGRAALVLGKGLGA